MKDYGLLLKLNNNEYIHNIEKYITVEMWSAPNFQNHSMAPCFPPGIFQLKLFKSRKERVLKEAFTVTKETFAGTERGTLQSSGRCSRQGRAEGHCKAGRQTGCRAQAGRCRSGPDSEARRSGCRPATEWTGPARRSQ